MNAVTTNGNDLSSLKTRRDILEILWRQGLSGRQLLSEHTQLIDAHLKKIFTSCPATSKGMALIAIGGYGREELFPLSDIDLLLLHAKDVEDQLSPVAEAVFYPLWDAGLEVGHSVRSVEASIADALNDFFFQVALLDARLVAGCGDLFSTLQSDYQAKFINGQRQTFFEKMSSHRNERHRRFGKHSYMLEPQVKESRGGLRDVQALLWTAKVVFGLHDIQSINNAGLLSKRELASFSKAWEHLIKIRNRLHYISGRKNDQLFFEHQEEIAKAFNYKMQKGLKDVECFMRDVYGHLQIIASTTDLFFEHVEEVISPSSPKKQQSKTLEPGITVRRNRIRINNPVSLQENPQLIMQVFMHCALSGKPVHHQTQRLISENINKIDKEFQADHSMAQCFLKMISKSKTPLTALESMHECGVLVAFLPEFATIQSLAQHDIYHVYTVDYHLIQTVAVLHQLKSEHQNIFELVSKPRALFLAGLLHDIGKGYGQDHSNKGSKLARIIGQRLGLKGDELEILEFAVQNHLYLADTALKRDIEDISLIEKCAARLKSPEHLAVLYLLTIADAMATGPTVWNDWKAALVLDLYLKIALHMEKSTAGPGSMSMGADWVRQKVKDLFAPAFSFNFQSLPEDYLLNFSPKNIKEHISYSQNLDSTGLVLLPTDHQTSWSVLIITKDRPGLLTKLCGVIALHNLEVLAAQIFTWPDRTAVDILDVRSAQSASHSDQHWPSIKNDLKKAINLKLGLEYRLNRKRPSRRKTNAKKLHQPTKVVFDNKLSDKYSVVEIYAENHSVLIFNVTRVLADFLISIHRAKIGTHSDQAVIVFYILDRNNQKIEEKNFINELKESLRHAATSSFSLKG